VFHSLLENKDCVGLISMQKLWEFEFYDLEQEKYA